jgi:hypothetical protein
MPFDYQAAKERVKKELTDLVEQIWPDVQPVFEKYKWPIPEQPLEKARRVSYHLGHIKDEQKRKKFSMLCDLSTDTYWHATDFWPEIRKSLAKEDERFYATLMIEMAKRDHEQGELGYAWIVKSYDDGSLREFVSEEMLTEAVNCGFWEIANEYFTGKGGSLPRNYYDTLMNYSDILDLSSKVNQFKQKPLKANSWEGWPDERYIACFERARQKLTTEDGAWLARPIIERIIGQTLSWYDPKPNPDKLLKIRLEPYKEYLNTKVIQDLLNEEVRRYIKYCDNANEAYRWLFCAKILKPYLTLSESEFKELVSSSLPKESYRLERILVDINFPKEWLNEATLAFIKNKIVEHISEPVQHWQRGAWREKKEIISHLEFLQKCMATEWLDEKLGRERIKSGLETYLKQKRRPSGAAVVGLLDSLKPQFVEQELYRAVVHQGITDLVKRNRLKEASIWYRKAEHEGWLDKSKIPQFEVEIEESSCAAQG